MRRLLLIGAFLLSSVIAGCSDSSKPFVPPRDELTQKAESAHFIYFLTPGDSVDTIWEEAYYNWMVASLDLSVPTKLTYRKYQNRAQILRLTGRNTNGFADSGNYTFHTIWPVDNHESVHAVVVNLMGLPTALFNEGIAVANQTDPLHGQFDPRWSSIPLDTIVAGFVQNHAMPLLDSMLNSVSFFAIADQTTYPVAGSFMRFLIDSAGLTKAKTLFAQSKFADNAATTRSVFQSVYEASIDVWWQRWLSRLPGS